MSARRPERGVRFPSGRAVKAVAASGVLAAGLLVGGAGDVARAQEPCSEPYRPLASVDQSSGSLATLPEVPGDDVFIEVSDLVQGAVGPLDSDGDGQDDEIGVQQLGSDPATVTRGDGTLAFSRSDAVVSVSGSAGDLDGDGRDDIGVIVGADLGRAQQAFVVPGTTPPGSYDPADVGIEVGDIVTPIPDRDGDGIVELLDTTLTAQGTTLVRGPTRIVSGAAVIAVGAPGDATGVPALIEAPGELLGFADLGRALPVLLTGETGGPPDAPNEGIIHLIDESGDEAFTTLPFPFVVNLTSTFARPQVLAGPAGTFLALGQSERSGARAYLWRVDDPCGELPAGPATPPAEPGPDTPPAPGPDAPPAVPISAEATFTG